MSSLIQNAIMTPDGTYLISNSVHDFHEHTQLCGAYYAVDGGLYCPRVAFSRNDYKSLKVFDDESFLVVREKLLISDGFLGFCLLKDASKEQLNSALERKSKMINKKIKLFIKEELDFREK